MQGDDFTTDDLIALAPNPKEFKEHIDWLIENDMKFKLGIDLSFVGFIEDYYYLSRIIPTEYFIIDVGCCTGVQHILFKNFKGYIGITEHPSGQKSFTNNAKFIEKVFSEAAKDIQDLCLNERTFGIANMSILYAPKDKVDRELKCFKNMFDRMYIN